MDQYRPYVKSALKLLIKEVVWSLGSRFTPSSQLKPICLYASRRSGSTLAMEMISANKGVRFSDQPFGLYTASGPNINRLPIFEYGQIISPDEEEWDIIKQYVRGLFEGEIRSNLPWKFWGAGYDFSPNRMLLKITDAKSIADAIDDAFQVETIVMTRNPIPQALSVIRNGWLVTGKAFLRNSFYVQTYLDDKLHAYGMEIYRKGSKLQQHVLDWILENMPLIRFLKERPNWIFVGYEGLVMNPEETISMLSERCALSDYSKMLSVVSKPSRSSRKNSTKSTQRFISGNDRQALVEAWKNKLTKDEIDQCYDLLETYSVNLYQPNQILPEYSSINR